MRRVHKNGEGFIVHGEINFANVKPLYEQGTGLIAECKQAVVTIDLSSVTQIDNVALALLTAWSREACQINKTVVYKNWPKSLENMAAVFGVDFLFNKNPSELPFEKNLNASEVSKEMNQVH